MNSRLTKQLFSTIVAVCLLGSVSAVAGTDAELRKAAVIAQKHGVDSAFLARMITSADAEFQQKAVKINVTNFSGKPDYSHNYNKESVKKVKSFVKENSTMLTKAAKSYGVPTELIASILWIESKCGQVIGKYHVLSVYLSVLMAKEPEYIQQSLEVVLKKEDYDASEQDSLKALVERRAERKSKWALAELMALQDIDKRKVMNVAVLKGSWAGAFGFPQFLPSSYQKWAVDGDKDGKIDLYNMTDAANSIGNYLKVNGWGKKQSQKRAAVFHYNNSDAYVDCVFTLAKKVAATSAKNKKKSKK